MKVLTVSHQKGGVGKTTLAMNLAACLRLANLNVAIMDTDLQGSLSAIADDLKDIQFVPPEEIANISSMTYDILIIDTPPYLMDSLSDLFSISDYILIPSKIGFYDVLAIRATLEIIKQVKKRNKSLKHGVVLNMMKSRTSITEDIKNLLIEYGAPVLNTMIMDRVAFTRSSISNGVFETDDQKAKDEIMSLMEEILSDI